MSTYISSTYGPRDYDLSHPHQGIDIAGSGIYGHGVSAAYDGKVIYRGNDADGYGLYVIVESDSIGYSLLYAHCSSLSVNVGDTVKQGQAIAKAGSTGDASGPHLHFEVRVNGSGRTIDPLNFTFSACNCSNIDYYRSHGNDGRAYAAAN